MTVVAAAAATVRLLDGCAEAHCLEMADRLRRQLSSGYTRGVSAMPLTGTFGSYLEHHRTLRKRAARCQARGYRFAQISRSDYEQDVYEINTSLRERQGRPMSSGYHAQPVYGREPKLCPHHHVYPYGVLHGTRLVAYLWLYRAGELALVSQILGHGAHLHREVMYLLAAYTVREQLPLGGVLVYNLHSSGQDGLRFFKERLGLAPTEARWEL